MSREFPVNHRWTVTGTHNAYRVTLNSLKLKVDKGLNVRAAGLEQHPDHDGQQQ